MHFTTSVLIPSYRRPADLERCLRGLARQHRLPDEAIVVWQEDDAETRQLAQSFAHTAPFSMHVVHNPERGIVPSENLALRRTSSEIVLLIDDDAEPPPEWVERHLRHYADPRVGAVGGSITNHRRDGMPFPKRAAEPVGKLTWYGRLIGNLYDHAPEWKQRAVREIDHVVGCNASFRRRALAQFETRLLPYWQAFEVDACLEVRRRGYRVLFDFDNVVNHHPTNHVFEGGRHGDLYMKVYHSSYNHAFVLSKHTEGWLRAVRLAYLLGAGSLSGPGLLAFVQGVRTYGNPLRELQVLAKSLRYHVDGWRAGAAARRMPETEMQSEQFRLPVN